MYKISVIGIAGDTVDPKAQKRIDRCQTLFCSSRHQECFDFATKKVLPLTPLAEMFERLEKELRASDVAVLASGDPLFFGIGRRLLAHFGSEKIDLLPAVSSMQLAASLFKIPWDDAAFISLHGRGGLSECAKLLNFPKVFVLTDSTNSPTVIASRLVEILADSGGKDSKKPTVYIAENLGLEDEHLTTGTLEQISAMTFGALNIMAIVNPAAESRTQISYGLLEDELFHSRGLITKNEVRAATLHALRLPATGVFWDIGSGSGSISIEAAKLQTNLQIKAIEKEPEQLANIKNNRQRFKAFNIDIIDGMAPAALKDLPDPDRVFIGGSAGHLEEIIEISAKRLAPAGRIIVNGVLEKTKNLAPKLLHEAGLKVTISEVAVLRHCYPPTTEEKTIFNSISIMSGAK